MRKRKIGFQLIFSLIVIVLFSYLYNLMPSKINRTYECNIFDVSEKKIVGKTTLNIRGKISKGFFVIRSFDGTIKQSEEIFECKDLKFHSNTTIMNNNGHTCVLYLTTNERTVLVIKLDEKLKFKKNIITNIPGKENEISRKYYQILNKMNKE